MFIPHDSTDFLRIICPEFGGRLCPVTIGGIIHRAQVEKLRKTVSSRTLKNEPYYIEARGCALRRPRLTKPSRATTDLVNKIFKNFLLPSGQVNIDLIKKTLCQCPPEEDLLLIEDEGDYNLLHRAVILGDVRVVEILINHGCDVNGIKSEEVCGRGRLTHCPHEYLRALHLACFLGHLDVVQYLLEKGADPGLQMKVYTSMTTKDTNNLQSDLDVINSMQPPTPTTVISQCGHREAAFYAVLKNNVTIVKLLLQTHIPPVEEATADISYLLCFACCVKSLFKRHIQLDEGATSDNSYLLHLACRVGAYESFEYLLGQFPSYVNTRDTDGLPLLLMALKNDTRFVKLLLEQDCDLHVLDEYLTGDCYWGDLYWLYGYMDDINWDDIYWDDCYWHGDYWHGDMEPGTNILHLLFKCVRSPYNKAPEGISDCVKLCLKMGVNVNRWSKSRHRTPLHELVETLNFTPDVDKIGKTDNLGLYLKRLDKELIECVYTLVNHGADLHIKDCLNRTPLEAILLNQKHLIRYNMSKKVAHFLPTFSTLDATSYGLENTLKTIKILVKGGAINKDLHLPGYPLIDHFVDLLVQSIEMLIRDSVFETCKEISETLLSAGADPNIIRQDNSTPLLRLVYSLISFPREPGHPLHFEKAQRLAAFISILISHGAHTEPGLVKVSLQFDAKSSFNMLMHHGLKYPRDGLQPARNLQLLHMLVTLLFQHGASSRLFRCPLYYVSESARQESESGCYPHPEYTFLFQYLMFGMSNLAYVNDGPWYYRIFDVLYSQIDHQSLYGVLGLAMAELSKAHPAQDCECGQCGQFKAMLESVADKPRTLKKLARLVIYNSLKGKLEAKLPQLPLPNVIKEYIMSFEDYGSINKTAQAEIYSVWQIEA